MLRNFDIFKTVPETRFKGEKGGHSSQLGQTLTLLIIAGSIALFVYFSLDMFTKSNPAVQTTSAALTSDIIITNETFPFAFGLRDINNNFYINDSIYYVKATFDTSKRTVDLVPCKPTNFQSKYNPTTQGPLWCFAEEQSNVTQIGISKFDTLIIEFYKCENSTTTTCLSDDAIDEALAGGRASIYFYVFDYDPENYENPLTQGVRAASPSLTTELIKETYYYMSQYSYISDNGWLFSSSTTQTRLNVDSVSQAYEQKSIMGRVFTQICLITYGRNNIIKRSYILLPEVLSKWNAIFTLLLISGRILSSSYNRFKSQESLVKDVFYLKNSVSRKERNRSKTQSWLKAKKALQAAKALQALKVTKPLDQETLPKTRKKSPSWGLNTLLKRKDTQQVPELKQDDLQIIRANTALKAFLGKKESPDPTVKQEPSSIVRSKKRVNTVAFDAASVSKIKDVPVHQSKVISLSDLNKLHEINKEEKPSNKSENDMADEKRQIYHDPKKENPQTALSPEDVQIPHQQKEQPLIILSPKDDQVPLMDIIEESRVQKPNRINFDRDYLEVDMEQTQRLKIESPLESPSVSLNMGAVGLTPVENLSIENSKMNLVESSQIERLSRQSSKKISIDPNKPDLAQEEPGIGFWSWICSKLKKTERYKLYQKRKEIIQRELDFQSHAKRFFAIDVLKYLLLSKDQLIVFDNCVKAYVNLKIDTTVAGGVGTSQEYDDLRGAFSNEGFPPDVEDDALLNLRGTPNPNETTKRTLHLLEMLFPIEDDYLK